MNLDFSKKFLQRVGISGIILLLGVFGLGFAQSRGTIKGRVVDMTNKEPLPGVNVVVKGTYKGAATDVDGGFIIPGLSPGQYTLEFSMIGYKVVQQTGVRVRAGQVTELEVAMEPTVLALGQEIKVVGERPLFNIEETASLRSISSDEIRAAVVENIRDIVSTQVGVVAMDNAIHIRGGRAYEHAFLVDGVSVQDPLAGTGFGLHLSSNMIEEVEIITGGINAEYGQAMSGVINVKTKEGGTHYRGYLSYKRDHFGKLNADSPHNFMTDILEVSLMGPEPLTSYLLPALGLKFPGRLSFFANGYMFISNDYTRRAAKQLYSSTFYGTRFAPRENNQWMGTFKLTWRPNPRDKFNLNLIGSAIINQNTQSLQTRLEYVPPNPGYPYKFQKNLDNFNTFTHLSNTVQLHWTHTLNPKSFFELRLSRFFANLRSDWQGKHWREYMEPKDIVTLPLEYFFNEDSSAILVIPGDGFYDYGNSYTWHDHYVEEYTLRWDFTSHPNPRHKIKLGVEATYQAMQLIDIYAPWFGEFGLNNDIYRVYPNFGAFYIQDNIHFSGMIANLGLRFDYWFPGKYVEDAIKDPEIETISETTRRKFYEDTYEFLGRRWKGRISPRIGISHPISDNQMLFFSYGHFNKRPKPQFIYAKLGKVSAKSSFQKFGNPNLNPETTVAYELGLKQKFTENDVFTLTAYYKDIFDYVTTVSFKGWGRFARKTFITYLNLDYSRARGIEVEYRKRAGQFLTGVFSASYSIATGKSSSPDDAYLVARGQLQEKSIKENYLVWDRPWQISATINLHVAKGKGPRIFGWKIPEDWNLNIRFFAESGRRYTPYIFIGYLTTGRPEYRIDIDNPYSKVADYWMWVDVNFEKYFRWSGLNITFFVEVLNLFDRRNSNIINPVTGRAYEYGDPTPITWNDPLYPDLQAPVEPYPFNPARYLAPRNVRLGVAFEF